MFLKRIHAVRHGALEDVTLGDLGCGLSIVLGENEAGKSTLVDLVRRVLYGFPFQGKERDDYRPASGGKRHGRLVFADGEREWVVERLDGTRGGEPSVLSDDGRSGEAILREMTKGVSSQAFKVVFGFGLDELAIIENCDSDDDVLGRLYAASAGLAVSPQDVRASIAGVAEAIFSPSARKREMNLLHHEERELMASLRESADRVAGFAADRQRLAVLTQEVTKLEAEAVEAARLAEAMSKDADELEEAEEGVKEAESRATEARRAKARASATLEAIAVDEAALAAGPEAEVLIAESSGFKRDLVELERRQGERQTVQRELDGLAADAGSGVDLFAVKTDADSRAETERRGREVENAEAVVRQVQAESVAASPQTVDRRRWWPLAVTSVVGVAAFEIGLATVEWVVILIGALMALISIPLWWYGPRLVRKSTAAGALPTDVGGPRNAAAQQALASARADYAEWLGRIGLPSDLHPAEVRRLVSISEKAQAARIRSGDVDSVIGELVSAVTGFTERLASAAREEIPAPSGALVVLERLRADFAAAREADDRRRELEEQIAGMAADESSAVEEARAAKARAMAVLERYPDAGDSLDGMRRLASAALKAAQDADEAHREVRTERDRLDGALASGVEDSTTAEIGLEIAGVRERMADAAERYLVHAVATRLLDTARARYERERQPEVVKRSEAAFRRITNDRYSRLAIPLGGESIRVTDGSSESKTSELLSRGTAEQMYLALRLGLLETLGDIAPGLPVLMDDVFVNFDPERARGAAGAVADLAANRQVVLFTCHPATLALFGEVADPVVLEMGRC